MSAPKCMVCKKPTTGTAFWGPIGNRYQVPACSKCRVSMEESDREFAALTTGFAAYNAYYDNK
jgi:hypothetical protein